MSAPLLVVGSVALDTVETRAGKRGEILGGSAVFVSLAASHFGPVRLVGVVGEGDFPDEHVELLTSRGVDVQGLDRQPGRTFRWSGVYADDFSSRTTLDTQLGVFASFAPDIPESYRDSRVVMLGNIHPALQLQVLDAVDDDAFVAADTMNLWIDTTPDELAEVVRRVDLLIINDEEAQMMTGEPQVRVAAEQILARGPEALVIKRGEHGAYLFTAGEAFFAPAMPLDEVIDPTGAGDTFAGGLAGLMAARGDTGTGTVRRGMVYGAALASIAVQGFGVDALREATEQDLERRFDELRTLVSLG